VLSEEVERGVRGTGQSKTGTVSFREVQAHTSRFGGSSLTETELSEIFKEFDSAQDNQVRMCVSV
jgi:Ca2+-binding EF-hand superfamily protein